jgi:hypothetical protein
LDVTLGFYPGGGKVEIRLSAARENLTALESAEGVLRDLLRDYLI